MWNIIEDAREKSLSEEKENMENEANEAEPDENIRATTFQDLRKDLDDKLEGDNKGTYTVVRAWTVKTFFRKLDNGHEFGLCALPRQ